MAHNIYHYSSLSCPISVKLTEMSMTMMALSLTIATARKFVMNQLSSMFC